MKEEQIRKILEHPLMSQEWVTTTEAAEILDASPATIIRSIRSGWFVGFDTAVGLRRAKWHVKTDSIRARIEGNVDPSSRDDNDKVPV